MDLLCVDLSLKYDILTFAFLNIFKFYFFVLLADPVWTVMTARFRLPAGRTYNVRASELARDRQHTEVVCNVLLLDNTVQAFRVNVSNLLIANQLSPRLFSFAGLVRLDFGFQCSVKYRIEREVMFRQACLCMYRISHCELSHSGILYSTNTSSFQT